ncbi:MAG: HEAT repeat protein, partial [Gammaproteobacteria bacterium]
RLQVPRNRPGSSATPGQPEAGDTGEVTFGPAGPLAGGADTESEYVFEELMRTRDPRAKIVQRAEERLLAMGEEGLVAARRHLSHSHGSVLLIASRVMLVNGTTEDHRLVAKRLQTKVPSKVAPSILRELIERDPVFASPQFLVALLDHPTAAMRMAAERELSPPNQPAPLADLALVCNSRRADARLRAVNLVGNVEDPGALLLLAERLGDGTAKVAVRAAELLASWPGEEVDELLRARAFAGEMAYDAGRAGAYALLALTHREERTGAQLIGEADIPRLLDGLRERDPLLAVSAAVALADVGFRSPRSFEYTWLDLEVPHALVRWGSGAEFHSDFSSFNEIALRRMALLSGETFGFDGPAWRRWWMEMAGDFRARRAVVPVSRLDAAGLTMTLRTGFRAEDAVVIMGPAAKPEVAVGVDRVIYIDVDQSEALFDLLEREGVFGADRLPAEGNTYRSGRLLDVHIGAGDKQLGEPRGSEKAWFERILSALAMIEADNAWQRWFDPQVFSDQHTFWEATRARMGGDVMSLERVRAETELLLARVASFAATTLVDEREEEVLSALEERFSRPGIAQAGDFGHLTRLLDNERYHGRRAAVLLGIALEIGRVSSFQQPTGDVTEPGDKPSGVVRLDPSLAQDLLEILLRQEGPGLAASMSKIVFDGGEAMAYRAAAHTDARLRSLAAEPLALSGTEENKQILMVLIADPDSTVVLAVCQAVAKAGLKEFGTELELRAHDGPPDVRAAALRGLVRLEYPDVLELLRVALYEPSEVLQLAGAEGIAALQDPATVPVLARLLGRDPSSAIFVAARRGLMSLGEAAVDDLLVLANSASEDIRREAALILAEQGEAEAMPLLLTTLSLYRDDGRVANEIAILSCMNFGGEENALAAYWDWWDVVVHDNSRAWIAAAGEMAGLAAPPLTELTSTPTEAGLRFYLDMLDDTRPHVVERVRRELSRILGRDLVLKFDFAGRGAQMRALAVELELR